MVHNIINHILVFFFNFYNSHHFECCIAISTIMGTFIGLERELRGKSAGIRTYAIVTMASCLFTILSVQAGINHDTTRIAASIVSALGFLGAGVIWHKDGGMVEGLTTASSLWASSALGMAIGFGFISLAITSAIIVLLVMELFGVVAKFFKKTLKLKTEKQ